VLADEGGYTFAVVVVVVVVVMGKSASVVVVDSAGHKENAGERERFA
jgi:hypothetical protein